MVCITISEMHERHLESCTEELQQVPVALLCCVVDFFFECVPWNDQVLTATEMIYAQSYKKAQVVTRVFVCHNKLQTDLLQGCSSKSNITILYLAKQTFYHADDDTKL